MFRYTFVVTFVYRFRKHKDSEVEELRDDDDSAIVNRAVWDNVRKKDLVFEGFSSSNGSLIL
jgi:hypothetical protein